MHIVKLATVVAITGLLAMTSVAHAGRLRGEPSPRDPGHSSDTEVVMQVGPLALDPHSLKCFLSKTEMYDGKHVIWVENTGTETIPAPFWVTITWPDGTKSVFKSTAPLNPHDAWGLTVPLEHFKEPFKCGAKLSFEKP